jgi:hypothetical protein
MPEQRAATSETAGATFESQAPESEPKARADAEARADSKAASEPPAPTGTRELRDAQSRPPIRAEGKPAETASEKEAASSKVAPLFDKEAGHDLRERWLVIQTEFVDEPRAAVEKADSLVAEVLKRLTDTFAREREELEAGWSRSEDDKAAEVSTEDLRQAIRRYRSFFDRLLSL